MSTIRNPRQDQETTTEEMLYILAELSVRTARLSIMPNRDRRRREHLVNALRERLHLPDLREHEITALALVFAGGDPGRQRGISQDLVVDIVRHLELLGLLTVAWRAPQHLVGSHQREYPPWTAVSLNPEFIATFSPQGLQDEELPVLPFPSIREYYDAWFSWVKNLQGVRRKMFRVRDDDEFDLEVDEEILGNRRMPSTEAFRCEQHYERLLKRSLCTPHHPMEQLVQALNLDDTERGIIVFLLVSALSNSTVQVDDVEPIICRDIYDVARVDTYLGENSKLLTAEVIDLESGFRFRNFRRMDIWLRSNIQHWLLTGEGVMPVRALMVDVLLPYASNEEYLDDWMEYAVRKIRHFQAWEDHRGEFHRMRSLREESVPSIVAALETRRNCIEERTRLSSDVFPLQQLIADCGLSDTERDILLIMLCAERADKDFSPTEIVRILGGSIYTRTRQTALFDAEAPLRKHHLIESNKQFFGGSSVHLNPQIRDRILGIAPAASNSLVELVQNSELFTELHPYQTLEDLVLPQDLTVQLQQAVLRYEVNADQQLREWGILPPVVGESTIKGSMLLLFSGESGTGKTFAAGALANSMGKKLLATDVSKLLSAYVGESEKNLSTLFDVYEEAVRNTENPPMLLLNECDQFFSKRSTSPNRAVERMYHQMQNLFLERLERFVGCLVATTNLVTSLDEAFSRRFHLKLVFPQPEVNARREIWKRHLRPPVPLLADVDLDRLAQDYHFSGGQISLVVRNAALTAAIRKDGIGMEDLLAACRAEVRGDFGERNQNHHVGFRPDRENEAGRWN